MTDPISISINFDSLNEAYGFPEGYRDPSFFAAFDRVAELAARYAFPLTIFIIGRDIENPEHAARVREWSHMGHEIGNHTWSHHFNLASLPKKEIRSEIGRAHDRIAEVIGAEPVGFISPAWATSPAVIATLKEMRYEYDTSSFPSMLFYPVVAKMAFNHRGNPRKALRMLHRSDWHAPLLAKLEPHLSDNLVILPLPTIGRFSLAIWHTLGFMLGWERCFYGMQRLLETHSGFYYLIHPADFLAPGDLHPTHAHSLARMDVPLDEKMARLEQAFAVMQQSARSPVTLRQAASFHRLRLLSRSYGP
jgi:hypothetical protein